MTWARKTDGNLKEIAKAYRKLGCRVHVTNGDWDLTVQSGWLITDLVEVKDDTQPLSNQKVRTKRQKETHDKLAIQIVKNVNDVAAHVAEMRARSHALMQAPLPTNKSGRPLPGAILWRQIWSTTPTME